MKWILLLPLMFAAICSNGQEVSAFSFIKAQYALPQFKYKKQQKNLFGSPTPTAEKPIETSRQNNFGLSLGTGLLIEGQKMDLSLGTGMELSNFNSRYTAPGWSRSNFQNGERWDQTNRLLYINLPVGLNFKYKKIRLESSLSTDFLVYVKEDLAIWECYCYTEELFDYYEAYESNNDRSNYNIINFTLQLNVEYLIHKNMGIIFNYGRKLRPIQKDFIFLNYLELGVNFHFG